MLSAFKRRKKGNPNFLGDAKTLFKSVLPYLFPGNYDRNYFLAFKTFLALSGTCRKLRYWNSLRRWIGWLSPLSMRGMLRVHSFPVPMTSDEYLPVQDRVHRYLEMHGEIPDAARIDFVSRTVSNAQVTEVEGPRSNFEVDFAGIPFFDVIDCYVRSPNKEEERKIIAFRPSTFAELVLFCHAALSAPLSTKKDDAIIVVCGWKTVDDGVIYIKERDRQNFVKKSVLGRLSKLGTTAPAEIGFERGSLPLTSFSFFLILAEKRSHNNKYPMTRLEQFAHRWYPYELYPTEQLKDNKKFKPAYNFDIIFEAPPVLEQATQENAEEEQLDRSKSMEIIKPKKRQKSK